MLSSTSPPVAPTSGSANGAISSFSQRASGTASSSMNATISPAAAATPRLRERETLRSGLSTTRSASCWARNSPVPSVEGPLTTTTSKSRNDCRPSALRVFRRLSSRLYVQMTTVTRTGGLRS